MTEQDDTNYKCKKNVPRKFNLDIIIFLGHIVVIAIILYSVLFMIFHTQFQFSKDEAGEISFSIHYNKNEEIEQMDVKSDLEYVQEMVKKLIQKGQGA